MPNRPFQVHKFGGTSVGSPDAILRAASIINQACLAKADSDLLIVVSAMSGVTNALIEIVQLAKQKNPEWKSKIASLQDKHEKVAQTLIKDIEARSAFNHLLRKEIEELNHIAATVEISRTVDDATLDLFSGYGELWSSRLLANTLSTGSRSTKWLDARTIITLNKQGQERIIDWNATASAFNNAIDENVNGKFQTVFVATGYVARTVDGAPTTLGRNGSDFSGAIFGKLSKATEIIIWTDVDGILSADPRRVPEAVIIDALTYEEAIELAYFGAKVVHPHTMMPAIEDKIPIWIRNTFKPELRGSCIVSSDNIGRFGSHKSPIKGFTTIDDIAIINVEGNGMMGVPGVASRMFSALKEVGVSVILISQASSEHSICIAIEQKKTGIAKEALSKAFALELQNKSIREIEVVDNCSVLAAVGDEMAHTPGIASKFFGSLGRAGVSIVAIAQGSSERNISAVIRASDSTRALRAVHAAFLFSQKPLSIGILGTGSIGRELLSQLQANKDLLSSTFKSDISVRFLANTKKVATLPVSEKLASIEDSYARFGIDKTGTSISRAIDELASDPFPHHVIFDCTASDEFIHEYPAYLKKGIHVITPNKRANASELALYHDIRTALTSTHAKFFYEATVGAGLPILATIRDLIDTGDEITEIQGIMSGTLSYLFNGFDPSKPFSEMVKGAKDLGYTEPDPRDDLSGQDVGRKCLILAREMGIQLESGQVEIESLVPDGLKSCATSADFVARIHEADAHYLERYNTAKKNGACLRYVATISKSKNADGINGKGHARVRLEEIPNSHPFARLTGTDNIFLFKTKRYSKQPLVIQGPGAGPEVTAAGIYSDLLRLIKGLSVL